MKKEKEKGRGQRMKRANGTGKRERKNKQTKQKQKMGETGKATTENSLHTQKPGGVTRRWETARKGED